MNEFYTYLHRDPDSNEIKYVGKGKKYRAYALVRKNFHGRWLQKLLNAGKKPIVEIVKKNLSESEAFHLEMELIAKYKQEGHQLCNLTLGGEGTSGYKWDAERLIKFRQIMHSPEYRKKISEATKGRKRSEETKKKLSLSKTGKKGKKWSEESKLRLSKRLTGLRKKPLSDESKHKLSLSKFGKIKTEETKKRIGAKSRNRIHTQESREKSSKIKKAIKNGFQLKNKFTGESKHFKSMTNAALYIKSSRNSISSLLHNERDTLCGWEFLKFGY